MMAGLNGPETTSLMRSKCAMRASPCKGKNYKSLHQKQSAYQVARWVRQRKGDISQLFAKIDSLQRARKLFNIENCCSVVDIDFAELENDASALVSFPQSCRSLPRWLLLRQRRRGWHFRRWVSGGHAWAGPATVRAGRRG